LENIYYSPSDSEFWNWNWDQHALIDLPAVVNYVTEETSVPQVYLIGHSQGATIGFAALSNMTQLSSQIKLFIGLAPVTYMSNQQSILLGDLASLHADFILKILGNGPFTPTTGLLDLLLATTCLENPQLCNNILGSLFGPDNNLDPNRMDVYTAHWPDKTSVQNLIHWLENTRSGQFQAYNNGPDYIPSQITCPVAVFYGSNDYLADPVDVQTLISATGSSIVFTQEIEGFAHMDFTWAYSAATQVYPDVLNLLQKY